jgi:hypothetical protein
MVVSHIESTNKSWKRLVHEKQKQNKHNPFLLPNELVESEQTHANQSMCVSESENTTLHETKHND